MAKGIYVGALKKHDILEFTSNPMPTSWVQGETVDIATAINDYGEWTLNTTNQSASETNLVSKVADGFEDTYWVSRSHTTNDAVTYIELELPVGVEIKPTNIRVRQHYCGNTSYPAKIQGYDGAKWVDLGAFTKYTSATTQNFVISEDVFFTKFRLELHRYNSSYKSCYIWEFSLDSGTIKYPAKEEISVAHKVKRVYVGVNDVARKVNKGYIGVGGIARLFYSYQKELSYYGTAENLTAEVGSLAATSVGDYALFAGGSPGTGARDDVNTYSSTLVKGTTTNLSEARYGLAATRVKAYALFAGGYLSAYKTTVDAYNNILTKVSVSYLTSKRAYLAATNVGDYALFAGGHSGSASRTVDTYTSSLAKGTATLLSDQTRDLAGTSVGDYALFAGGYDGSNCLDIVNTYTSSLAKGTATKLSVARRYLVGTSVGDYALFAGGYDGSNYLDAVDVYSSSLVKGTATDISISRYGIAAAVVDGYALIGGGTNGVAMATVDVYDANLTKSVAKKLSIARANLAATNVGDYALFGGGDGSAVVDVYQVI